MENKALVPFQAAPTHSRYLKRKRNDKTSPGAAAPTPTESSTNGSDKRSKTDQPSLKYRDGQCLFSWYGSTLKITCDSYGSLKVTYVTEEPKDEVTATVNKVVQFLSHNLSFGSPWTSDGGQVFFQGPSFRYSKNTNGLLRDEIFVQRMTELAPSLDPSMILTEDHKRGHVYGLKWSGVQVLAKALNSE